MKGKKSIIITGATGFIGGVLLDKFQSQGYKVYAIVRKESDSSRIEQKAEILVSDGENWESLKGKINAAGDKIFYHLAWQGVNGSDKGDAEIQIDNIRAGIRVAKFANEIGCTKFLCAGSIAEEGLRSIQELDKAPVGLLYAAAKRSLRILLETYCKSVGLHFVWMQFSNVYGAENRTGNIIGYTLENILSDKEACFGPAQQPYDLISVNDLAEAAYRLGVKDTKRNYYFIGSGTPRKLEGYLRKIGEIAGKDEFIKIGVKPDDGIRYSWDMFDNTLLEEEIGEYITESFEKAVQITIQNWNKTQRI